MKDDEFRRAGAAAVDWVADYWERLESFPVLSDVEPGALRRALPASPPEEPEGFEAILEDVDRLIVPGLTHWQSPNFFAYFPANASGPSVLGELLSAGMGVQGMLWATSPACTELESHVLDWLAELLGLPAGFRSTGSGGGVIQDSASSATLCALLAARERATDGASNRSGVRQPLVAYASDQAHSSVDKAVRIAGLGQENLRKISHDPGYAMRADELERTLAEDRRAGRIPAFVVATLGTTGSGALDPVGEIAEICHRESVWLHVDAAYAGSAAVCPEYREVHAGLEGVDSYCVNPHKWLLTNFDCDAFYVSDRRALTDALSISPPYLANRASDSGEVIDYRDWQVPLGRRFRALKLWFVLRSYGARGLREHVRKHVASAVDLCERIDGDSRFERVAPRSFGLICFRHRLGDETSRDLLDRINQSGDFHLTGTELDGGYVLRIAVGGARTEAAHVDRLWQRISDLAPPV